MKTRGYVLRKLGQTALTTFVVLAFNFFLFRIMPGDPVRILIRNPKISAAALQRVTEQFGLNQSKFVQFGYYLRDLCMANLGHSFVYRKPVLDVIMEKLPPTLLLTGTATVLSIVIGIVLGVIFAWKRGSKLDVAGLSLSLVLYSMPSFWVGILMVMLFAVYWRIFPICGMSVPGTYFTTVWGQLGDLLKHMFLPTVTFALILIGEYVLIMRNSLLEVMGEDYMLTARAKGVSNRNLLRRHALPNAMPVSYTHLDVYKRQGQGGHGRRQFPGPGAYPRFHAQGRTLAGETGQRAALRGMEGPGLRRYQGGGQGKSS